MAPKRDSALLVKKSVWDETLVGEYVQNKSHLSRIWKWLLNNPDKELCDVPYAEWSMKKTAYTAVVENFVRYTTKVVEKNESARGDTTKLLIELQDGHRVETVVMRHVGHTTVCVSSQIGCQMGCRFCATGTMGIIGNLTSGEILEQLAHANAVSRIRNVVFMGMGEPLNNYDNVKLAVESMIDVSRFGMSPRHVTVSTVGVLKSMRRMSEELPFINLALSLHAPNQEVRLKIVPAAAAHHIDRLMEAVDYHIKVNCDFFKDNRADRMQINAAKGTAPTSVSSSVAENDDDDKLDPLAVITQGQKGDFRKGKSPGVMIEYILIHGINDQAEHAEELAKLMAPRKDLVLVNLIPYNPTQVAEDYKPPVEADITKFWEICVAAGIHTRVRQEKGQDIAGACGQLALVNPGKALEILDNVKEGKSNARDIEDIVAGKKKMRVGNGARSSNGSTKNASAASASPSSPVETNEKKSSVESTANKSWLQNRCKVLLLANLAVPAVLVVGSYLAAK